MADKITLRIQSPNHGTKRLEVQLHSSLRRLFEDVHQLFKDRTKKDELISTSKSIQSAGLKHGDMIFLLEEAGPVAGTSSGSSDSLRGSKESTQAPRAKPKEDDVDLQLYKIDGKIQRKRDEKMCRHTAKGCCVHCSALEPWDENYLKEQKIKHLSFHSYIRKLTSGVDRGHQRMGFLYGTYEVHPEVPLGIRARVMAIYEPSQESSRDSIKLLDDPRQNDVDEVASALGMRCVGWIFTDLLTDNAAAGTVKQTRGIETHFLSAQECILAGHLQNKHQNASKYASSGYFGSKFVTVCVTGDSKKQVHMEGYAVSAQCMALVRDNCLLPTKDAPELGYIRESSDKQYVPDVYYKEKDAYGNEVQRLGRPLPVEYLLVDIPASTPVQQLYTFTAREDKGHFPIENRLLDGHLQDFNALSTYLSKWGVDEFLEAVSDLHLLIYLYTMDMLPLKAEMGPLFEAIKKKDTSLALSFKNQEVWRTLEQLISASSHHEPSMPLIDDDPMNVDDGPGWVCDHCTFLNTRSGSQTCEICNLPRFIHETHIRVTYILVCVCYCTRSYSMKPYNTSGDLKGFTWQGMKKHYAVLPLVGIIGCAVVGMCSFIGYSAFTRPDVNIRRKEKWIEADEQVDINNPKPKKTCLFSQKNKQKNIKKQTKY
uniref:CSON005178 protein n=1 Tax=Culicoides sonorensis TaxID=179676 RepID=A0A336LZR4_CULSO